ncbi:unnamed protein product, partial [Effrenium voratum]
MKAPGIGAMEARPLPFAHPADLLRADQKDELCRGELQRKVLEASEELLGRRAPDWQEPLRVLSEAAYASATAASGSSLGEEYSELLLVDRRLRPAAAWRRLAAPALGALSAWLMPRWEWAPLLLRLHLALFYLFGRFRHLPERLLGLRALSLAERPYRSFSYRPLGVLLLAQVLGQALAKLQRRSAAADSSGLLGAAAVRSACGPAPKLRLARGSPLCNICFCPAEHVTATSCGHLFCWDCIASWCAIKASCPLCRASCPPQKLLPLLHYASP